MTDDTIRLITASVRDAIRPSLERIHERIDKIDKNVAAIDERTRHMPKYRDLHDEIDDHADNCVQGRRWNVGTLIATGAFIVAAGSLAVALI